MGELTGHHPPVATGPVGEWQAWWTRQAERGLGGSGFVMSAPEVAAAGVSRQTARTRTRRGEWARAGYGFVAPLDIADVRPYLVARRRHAVQAAAAARRRPGHVISGRSAAIIHGLPTFRVPLRPELTELEPVGLGRRRGASHVYGAALGSAEWTTWFGVPVTGVARTLVDLARHDRRDAIMAADAALREELTERKRMDDALVRAVGWPGVRQARAVLALTSELAESPLESLTRLVLHDGGFPAPELQVWIGEYRVDMLLRAQRLVLEIDGLEKYTDAEARREKRRETRLRQMGYRVERITWEDVIHRWPQTSAWLRGILSVPATAG